MQAIVGSSNTVALDFGRAIFGRAGGIVFAGMVAFSCFGALNGASFPTDSFHLLRSKCVLRYTLFVGSFFTSARLIYHAGKEGYLPALFGRYNSKLKTPLNAMCLQAAITIAFIIIGGGFRSLINFAVVGQYTSFLR